MSILVLSRRINYIYIPSWLFSYSAFRQWDFSPQPTLDMCRSTSVCRMIERKRNLFSLCHYLGVTFVIFADTSRDVLFVVAKIHFFYLLANWKKFFAPLTISARLKSPDLPMESKELNTWARHRFREGLSLSGREVRHLYPRLVVDFNLPIPLHQAALAFTHITSLLYGAGIPEVPWRLHGCIAIFILHVVMEHLEEGSAATLYLHGLLEGSRLILLWIGTMHVTFSYSNQDRWFSLISLSPVFMLECDNVPFWH